MAIVLAFALAVLAGCGGNNSSGGAGNPGTGSSPSGTAENKTADNSGAADAAKSPAGTFTKVDDMLKASQDLYDLFARPINSSDEPLDLNFGNGLLSLDGYQINNDLNDDAGTFGDKNSEQGSYTKQGGQITVATDYTYAQSSMGTKAGDHILSSGAADLTAGTAWYETSTERSGAVISKSRYDYQFTNGALTALEQTVADVDATGRDFKTNTVRFIVIDKNSYQFVVGTATVGVGQSLMTFDPSKDTAAMKTAIQGAGYTIKYFGNVSDGKLNLQ